MEPVVEVIDLYEKYRVGLMEAKIKANRVLGVLYYRIYNQSYPRDYLDMVYQNSLFEFGYLFGRDYQDVPEVFKEAFK